MIEYDIVKEIPRIGKRAEILAEWYFRFNGYFPISNFIIHDAGFHKQPGGQLTEADILAIRLPYTIEVINGTEKEIVIKTHKELDVKQGIMDFIIVEVSSGICKNNWIDKKQRIDRYQLYKLCITKIRLVERKRTKNNR